jgi:DNA-binding MarR family transcriptional regulator
MRITEQLAELLPQMMMQMVRLGDALPPSAADLTPQQLRVITALHHSPSALRMTELAVQLGVTQSTVTDTAKRLISMGYLIRERSSEDDRVVHISLSPKGDVVAADLKQARLEVFERICAKLTPTERKKLLESHQLIFDTYRSLSMEQ